MRQFLIDDLSREERDNLENYLKREARAAEMGGLFWIDLPEELLSARQREHLGECGPYAMAVELTERAASFELLVRNRANLHCDCIAYADPRQRDFLLAFIDRMIEEEMIRA
jgi:hypothetical protein